MLITEAIHALTDRFGVGYTEGWDVLFGDVEPSAIAAAVRACIGNESKFPTTPKFRSYIEAAERGLAEKAAMIRRPECQGKASGCESGWIYRTTSDGTLEVIACAVHNRGAAAAYEQYSARVRRRRESTESSAADRNAARAAIHGARRNLHRV